MSGFAIRNPYFIVVVYLLRRHAVVKGGDDYHRDVHRWKHVDGHSDEAACDHNRHDQTHDDNEIRITQCEYGNSFFIDHVYLLRRHAVVKGGDHYHRDVHRWKYVDGHSDEAACANNRHDQTHDDNEIRIANGESRHCLFLHRGHDGELWFHLFTRLQA